MEVDNLLLIVAVVAVVVSVVGAGITYNSLLAVDNFMTGFATSIGEVNVTISDYASINFTTSSINFGSGAVSGDSSAILNTNGTATIGGSWTSPSTGFVIENIGNVNVSLRLATGYTAATLTGGTGASYQYMAVADEANSCTGLAPSSFADVNTTADGTLICSAFRPETANDQISIDVKLVIPPDATLTGAVGDFFTATIAAV